MTPAEKSEFQALLAEGLATLKADVKADLLPLIDSAAKTAVAAASPMAAVFADPIIDEVDAYVANLLGNPVPAVTAPTDTASQIASLQQHVAALTVATGAHSTAALSNAKVATPAAAAAVAAAVEAGKGNAS